MKNANNLKNISGYFQEHGFSLVELMVSMVLGIVVALAALAAFIPSLQLSRSQSSINKLNESGIYTIDMIARQVRFAGYGDWLESSANKQVFAPEYAGKDFLATQVSTTLGNIQSLHGCDGAYSNKTALLNLGCNAPTGAAAATGSGLTIAYQVLSSQAGSGATDLPTTFSNAVGFSGDCASQSTSGASSSVNGVFAVNRIYHDVATQRVMCLGNGGVAAFPIANNVEQFQVLYGVGQLNSPLGSVNYSKENLVAQYVNAQAITDASNWANVNAVQICILSVGERGSAIQTAGVNNFVLDCAGNPVVTSDGRLRRAYTAIANVRALTRETLLLN